MTIGVTVMDSIRFGSTKASSGTQRLGQEDSKADGGKEELHRCCLLVVMIVVWLNWWIVGREWAPTCTASASTGMTRPHRASLSLKRYLPVQFLRSINHASNVVKYVAGSAKSCMS